MAPGGAPRSKRRGRRFESSPMKRGPLFPNWEKAVTPMIKSYGILLAAALAVATVSGCGKPSEATSANDAGQVHVLNWSDYIGEHTNENFTRASGIAVGYGYFQSNRELEDALLTRKSGVDVVVPSSGFIGRQIRAGLFRKLDKAKLPNMSNLDPLLLKATEAFDPGHEYSVPYSWGMVGLGHNTTMIRQRMPDAPVDSWALLFNPKIVARFEDCGVALMDSPVDVMETLLIYLGKDAHTEKPADYADVRKALLAVKPFVKYLSNTDYACDLANGKICLAIGWNMDIEIAQARAETQKTSQDIAYVTPKEGTLLWVDNLAMPIDAPNVDNGLSYINYLLDPHVAAENANYVHTATPNRTALDQNLISEQDRKSSSIYPPKDVMEKSVCARAPSPAVDLLQQEIWSEFKNGL